jgi:hypothetical protein
MDKPQRRPNIRLLVGLVLLGTAYISMLFFRHTLTGTRRTDGFIGILLGLYIASHPAANFLDMLLFGRYFRLPGSSRRAHVLWILLNLLILGLAWFVITVATIRFTTRVSF